MKAVLKKVVLSFPELFAAKAFGDGDPKYSATLLIDKGSENDKIIKDAIDAVLKEKFGTKAESIAKQIANNSQRCCYGDGDEKEEYAGYAGRMALRVSSKFAPTVVDMDKSPLTQADGKMYSGANVVAIVNFYAYDNKFGKGVGCGISGIQFAGHGDALGGGVKASLDDFEDLSEGLTADDFM